MKYIANPVEVDAFVITGLGANLGENFGQEVTVDDDSTRLITPEQMARMTPVVGDYFVIQADGYTYINPKAVFERKYHRAEEHAESEVIEIASDGKITGPANAEQFLSDIAKLRN